MYLTTQQFLSVMSLQRTLILAPVLLFDHALLVFVVKWFMAS